MRWGRSHFRLLAGLALLAGLGLSLAGDRVALAGVDWSVDPLALAGAAALMALAPLAQALSLRVALRRVGAGAPAVGTLRVWARSYLLRYEPTGAVGFAYRVRERARLGASTPQVLTASAYEQIAAVTAGSLVALAASLGAGVRPSVLAWILAAGCAAAALVVRRLLVDPRVARWLSRRGAAIAGPLRGRTLAAMVALDGVGWAATGLGAWVVAGALLGPRAAPPGLVLLGAFALAWVVGVLTPLLPGGLGPRDAALAVALTPVVGPGRAVVLALGLRIVSLAGELVAVAVAEAAALVLDRRAAAAAAAVAEAAALVLDCGAAAAAAGRPPRAGRPPTRTDAPAGGRSVVVVPTYDERDALPLFVARFAAAAAADFDLLVVDDSSPDGTGELADALAADRPWLHVVHRAEKDGLGMAYRAGFAWCLEGGYAVIGQMDGDLSHPPEKLAELRRVLDERQADLVLGSRYMPGGGTDGWSRARLVLSRAGCRAARRVLGLPFSDLSGGFKLWRADCLAGLGLEDMLSAGYAFQVETTQLAFLAGRRIEEVPFVFSERVAGASKMNLRISLEAIRVTLALRRRRRRRSGLAAGGAR